LAGHNPRLLSGAKFAAVALVLRERKSELEVLLIQRALSEADPWSGHLAFPGGRQDSAEELLHETARRETLEELGFDLERVATRLGALDHLQTRPAQATGMVIAPYVYLLHTEPQIVPDAREVERVLWLELGALLEGSHDTQFELEREGARLSMPGYRVEDRVLWGMSYQMLRSLLQLSATP
jgi:8-oxo-dGTP pyrophosphatase MutT (NUDIX family)